MEYTLLLTSMYKWCEIPSAVVISIGNFPAFFSLVGFGLDGLFGQKLTDLSGKRKTNKNLDGSTNENFNYQCLLVLINWMLKKAGVDLLPVILFAKTITNVYAFSSSPLFFVHAPIEWRIICYFLSMNSVRFQSHQLCNPIIRVCVLIFVVSFSDNYKFFVFIYSRPFP